MSQSNAKQPSNLTVQLTRSLQDALSGRSFVLVVDQNIAKLHGDCVSHLEQLPGYLGTATVVPVESQKNLDQLSQLLDSLLSLSPHRDSVLVAIGGGITTDMAGLAAHLIKRGMPWLAVPTTLLGMIDAAIGGKTGVDTAHGKNLIGAFHLPEQVLVFPEFLDTLPEREWVNGIGEAVKYAFLERPDILEALYEGVSPKSLVLQHLNDFKAIKERIVAEDPEEQHQRMLLNLGHTLGHCLEKHFDYQRFAHGEAVLYGIYWSLVLSHALEDMAVDHVDHYLKWLSRMPWYDGEVLAHPEWFLSGLSQDKKIRGGRLNLVLLKAPGNAVIKPTDKDVVIERILGGTELRSATAAVPATALLLPHGIGGALQAPPSKSDSHRAIIAGALAALTTVKQTDAQTQTQTQTQALTQAPTESSGSATASGSVSGLVYSEDVAATLEAMAAFGLSYQRAGDQVTFLASLLTAPTAPVDCGESGSTLRFLIPLSQLVMGPVTYTGRNRLKIRPLNDYTDLFDQQGIPYNYNGELPMTVSQGTVAHQANAAMGLGGSLAGALSLKGNMSSQYFSGLFFALPLMASDSKIEVLGDLESKGYVDMTIDTLARHGVTVVNNDYRSFVIQGGQVYKPLNYTVEGDYSNAAFWIVAGQLGRPLRLSGLRAESLQRDREVIDVVQAMGGTIYWEGDTLVSMPSKTRGTVIDAREIPDAIPILCVLAALSEGETRVVNGERLRIKESDRIKSTVSELTKLGANIVETEDGMVIQGVKQLQGGCVDAWNDHRIAMAMAVASSRCQGPVLLTGAAAVKKSYPHFYSDFTQLGGRLIDLSPTEQKVD